MLLDYRFVVSVSYLLAVSVQDACIHHSIFLGTNCRAQVQIVASNISPIGQKIGDVVAREWRHLVVT